MFTVNLKGIFSRRQGITYYMYLCQKRVKNFGPEYFRYNVTYLKFTYLGFSNSLQNHFSTHTQYAKITHPMHVSLHAKHRRHICHFSSLLLVPSISFVSSLSLGSTSVLFDDCLFTAIGNQSKARFQSSFDMKGQ